MTVYALNTTVQEAFRSALGIADSPAFIDTTTPITPVAIIAQANTISQSQFVKLTDGTDSLDINTNGSIKNDLSVPSSVQTLVCDSSANITTNTTTAIYTVPAGKTFLLCGFSIRGVGGATDGAVVQLRNDGTQFFNTHHGNSSNNGVVLVNGCAPLQSIAATKVLDAVTTSTVGGSRVHYWGFLI